MWTEEPGAALLDRSVDLVMRSLKGVPTALLGIEVEAILERGPRRWFGYDVRGRVSHSNTGDMPDGSC